MSVTVENAAGLPYRIVGAQKEVQKIVTLDSSYLSEGEPLTAAELGLNVIEGRPICNVLAGDEAKESELFVSEAYYTPATEKIHLINAKTGKEVASTKNMEKVQVLVTARGK